MAKRIDFYRDSTYNKTEIPVNGFSVLINDRNHRQRPWAVAINKSHCQEITRTPDIEIGDRDLLAFIRGQVEYKDKDKIVLENQGMGYRIRVPGHILQEAVTGEEILLHTFMYVREDEISLFGFSSRRELATFETLLSISGIGPKAALALLSTMTVEDLYYAVFSDDVKSITRTPGIGPKGAKRLIMELKDKLDMEEIAGDDFAGDGEKEAGEPPSQTSGAGSVLNDAASALIALGYSGTEAWKAVRAVPAGETMDVEILLKEALKHML